MQNYKKVLLKIIPILILIFDIAYSLFLSAQILLSYVTVWDADTILRTTLISLEILIIFAMGILTFFSQHKSVFITSIILAIVDIILSIVSWWYFISIINIVYLLVILLFNYWKFHTFKF